MTTMPCALAIGGLDPGGGAGLSADLRAFSAAGVFGCAAASVLTIQSTAGMRAAHAVSPRELTAQVKEVLTHQRVRAIKTGALGSAENVKAVARLLGKIPAVVDTPIAPSRGRGKLLDEAAVVAMREALIPRASLVTANAPEAAILVDARVSSVTEAHDAALALVRLGAGAALVKGGHLAGKLAVDVLAVGPHQVVELRAARLPGDGAHGGGCVLASLIAGKIAAGMSVVEAVRWSKRVHHRALSRSVRVGAGRPVLVL
jgi:hydroxymethylpyrimidine/phosphomethylpyrimidine kinase